MSFLRQLTSALWAALWLHGRLLGLRLRRLFGRGPEADTGPDFQLLGADVLAAEADRDPVEIPAELTARLAVTRAELAERAHAAATPRTSPPVRRRRRAATLTVAAVLGLGVVGAGASALVSGSTGVPAVDRLLGIYEQNLSKPGAADRGGPSGSDLQPSASKAAEPIETVLPDGSKSVTTFYVAEDGNICWAVAAEDGSGAGGLGCSSPTDFVKALEAGGYVPGIEVLGMSHIVLRGYVRAAVVSLSGHGPNGPLEVQLGEPWTPSSLPAVGSLRPFVAVASLGSPLKLDGREPLPELERRSYSFDAVTDDGRQFRIRP
ncbi:MAG TPA: hypothetical protein VEW67_11935 [Thermoleophilaceae bacterium]|nr:hypothetical protein [Thermoleophilaceae bacterium]